MNLKRKISKCAIVLCMSLFFWGCNEDDENFLEGSITDSYNMRFDFVRIRLYPESALSIEYVYTKDEGEVIPLRVTIDRPEASLVSSTDYTVLMVGSIARGVGYDTSPLPTIESGTIHLDKYSGANGSEIAGSFKSVFVSSSGSKLNLRGGFSGTLERVE